jgi:hypothetical protein
MPPGIIRTAAKKVSVTAEIVTGLTLATAVRGLFAPWRVSSRRQGPTRFYGEEENDR